MAIAENKRLHESKKSLSRPVQTDLEAEDMAVLEEARETSAGLEDKLDSLTRKLRERDRSVALLQQELEMIKASTTQQADATGISKLHAKVQ